MISPTFIFESMLKTILDTFLAVAFLLALSGPLTESKVTATLRNSLASDVSGITLGQILNNNGNFPISTFYRIFC